MRTTHLLPVSPSMHCSRSGVFLGMSSWGVCVSSGGWYPSMHWGRHPKEQTPPLLGYYYSQWGCLLLGESAPRGCLLRGCVSQHTQRHPPWTESQTRIKTLPCPNFVADGNDTTVLLHRDTLLVPYNALHDPMCRDYFQRKDIQLLPMRTTPSTSSMMSSSWTPVPLPRIYTSDANMVSALYEIQRGERGRQSLEPP